MDRGGRAFHASLAAAGRTLVDRGRSLPVFPPGPNPGRRVGNRQVRRKNGDSSPRSAFPEADVAWPRGGGCHCGSWNLDLDEQRPCARAHRAHGGQNGRSSPGGSNPSSDCKRGCVRLGRCHRSARASPEAGAATHDDCSFPASARRHGSRSKSRSGATSHDHRAKACPRARSTRRGLPCAQTGRSAEAGRADDCS